MSPEEYKRIKEAEKAHLRKLKELKQAVRTLSRKHKISQAMADMTTSAADTLDENAALVDQLALETVRNEARLEMALDHAEAAEEDTEAQARLQAYDAEQQQARAQALVQRLKAQMDAGGVGTGSVVEGSVVQDDAPASSGPQAAAPASEKKDPLPEKTIGRMRR